jgi:hypothetical protein
VQTLADLEREREQAAVAVQLDGLSRSVHHDFAVVAPASVRLDSPFHIGIEVLIEIIRNFPKYFLAVQNLTSLKYLA